MGLNLQPPEDFTQKPLHTKRLIRWAMCLRILGTYKLYVFNTLWLFIITGCDYEVNSPIYLSNSKKWIYSF